jgi:hypothetical protein
VPAHVQCRRTVALLLLLAVGPACNAAAGDRQRLEQVYDGTGKLQLLRYDGDGDGAVDTISYMDGARILRIEIDSDENGTIDRWEYYTPDQQIEKIGTSRARDGHVDTWTYYAPDGSIVRLESSTKRDGTVNRIEHYQQGTLTRVEEDTNGDARIDKWEEYERGRLASVAFDTRRSGAPDRRLVYETGGSVRLDVAPNGDGRWVPASAER